MECRLSMSTAHHAAEPSRFDRGVRLPERAARRMLGGDAPRSYVGTTARRPPFFCPCLESRRRRVWLWPSGRATSVVDVPCHPFDEEPVDGLNGGGHRRRRSYPLQARCSIRTGGLQERRRRWSYASMVGREPRCVRRRLLPSDARGHPPQLRDGLESTTSIRDVEAGLDLNRNFPLAPAPGVRAGGRRRLPDQRAWRSA